MITTKLMTGEDLEAMGAESERYEIIHGELRDAEGSGIRHGAGSGRLHIHIGMFVLKHDLGEVLSSDTHYIFPLDPPETLAPDISFVRGDRWPAGELPEKYGRVIPDLVVEIFSPSNSLPEMLGRVDIYVRAGVPLVWLVDPSERNVRVFRSDGSTGFLTVDDLLDGETILPGFRLAVAAIFRRWGEPSV